jgi:hypothetical protein
LARQSGQSGRERVGGVWTSGVSTRCCQCPTSHNGGESAQWWTEGHNSDEEGLIRI